MISVCIPIYNYDCKELIQSLIPQLRDEDELILIDDASEEEFRQIHSKIQANNLRYIQLDSNIGRSKIRNLFLKYAKNKHLLFLDCDVSILQSHFIDRYKNSISEQESLVCGGLQYVTTPPSSEQALRWKYGVEREVKSVDKRNIQPNKSFMTSNFMVSRFLLEQHPFDERLVKYGHEDTLMGIRLIELGFTIRHIDNSVLHNQIETNEVFIEKTERGLENLKFLYTLNVDEQLLENFIQLLATYKKCKRFYLSGILKLCYVLIGSSLRSYLVRSKNPSIALFNGYKLLYFCALTDKK